MNADTEFKLRRFVRTVFESSTITDPDTLAKEVLRALDPKDERAALEQALRMVAQNFLTQARGSLTSLGGQSRSDAHTSRAAEGRTAYRPGWKVRGSREFWLEKLEKPFHIEGPDWLPLGDLGIIALTRIAEHRDMLSATNAKEAAGAREWAALLELHGVTTVRKLPESVLRERLQGEVAA
jgi:hypothetical protein